MVKARRVLDLERDEREVGRELDLEVELEAGKVPLDGLDDEADAARVRVVKVHGEARQLLLAQLGEVDENAGAKVGGADGGRGDHGV